VFGITFWLNPPTAKSPIAGAFPEIAWSVKDMAKAEQANMAVITDLHHWWVDKDGFVSVTDLSFKDDDADSDDGYTMAAFDITIT
ncbi:unnamed protein product, partial [Prorocentrum cordatum]